MNKIVIYDIDDLAFDLSLIKRPTVISREMARTYRSMLLKCDFALTTMHVVFLVTLGKQIFVGESNFADLER